MFQTFLTQFHLNCSHPSVLFGQFTQFTYSWFLGRDLIFQPSLTLTSINHGSILSLEIPDMREKKKTSSEDVVFIPGHRLHATLKLSFVLHSIKHQF